MIETDFFKAKKEWSKVKDELLGYYLKLYFAKIFATGKPVAYIDCFAGKGKYDDEKVGSPLLAMQLADEAGQRSKTGKCNIYFHFIEQVFAQELKKNLTPYTSNCYEVYDGGYNQHFANIVNQQHGNIFAYVDPFGIKFLDFNLFCMLAKSKSYSQELLLNFNTFGYIREGCRILKTKSIEEDVPVLDEYGDDSTLKNNTANMNRIANGEYWQQIIRDYDTRVIDAYEAERLFTKAYCKRLNSVFKYVLEIPIKVKIDKMPKYRMIYATNHPHGYIEMANNMSKRWNAMCLAHNQGQMSLFEIDYSNKIISNDVKDIIISYLDKNDIEYIRVITRIISNYGACYPLSTINAAVKELEQTGQIVITRNPALTTKTRQPARWINYKKDMKIRLLV